MVATATIIITVDDEDADLLTSKSNLRASQKQIAQVVAKRNLGPKPEGYHVDHIDNDWTNNRRDNLQYLPAVENIVKRNYRNKTTGFRGVSVTPYGKYKAEISLSRNRNKVIGHYATAEKAALAYDIIAYRRFGNAATTNNPLDVVKTSRMPRCTRRNKKRK